MIKQKKTDIYLIQTLLLSLLGACLIFGYYLLREQGFFTVAGNFNSQQLPFAEAVRNMLSADPQGEWIWNLDLGSSVVNGFAYYNLGSPFFWIAALFPADCFAYLAGILYIFKYVAAAAFSFLYFRRFVSRGSLAAAGALLYAFSGFQTVNLTEFHFHDMTAFFPLLLLGLEMAMEDRKYRPLFIFAVFLNCLTNYSFFIQELIFLILYFFVRYWGLSFRELRRKILSGILCLALGIGMGAVLFFPGILYLFGGKTPGSAISADNLVFIPRSLRLLLKGILLPGDTMNSLSAVQKSTASSACCYIPFFGLSLVFSYVAKSRDWIRKLILILGVICLFPILQSAFSLFTSVDQRWWYMPVLILVLATVKVLDKPEEYPVVKGCAVYLTAIAVFCLSIQFTRWGDTIGSVVYYPDRFWIYFAIAALGPSLYLLMNRKKRKGFKLLLFLTVFFCILTTGLTLTYYKEGVDREQYKSDFLFGKGLEVKDPQYRYRSVANRYLLPGEAAGIGAASSTIEHSSRQFDLLFDLTSETSTAKRKDIPGLYPLLAGKYVISAEEADNGETRYDLTEREACPIGFALERYILREDLMSLPVKERAKALMRAFVAEEETPALQEASRITPDSKILKKSLKSSIRSTRKNAVQNFTRDAKGFSCTTGFDQTKYVYFTVPYDSGWKASIDKEQTKILNSGGMMVIPVTAGEHEILFEYHTPGFRAGKWCSVICGALWLIFTAYELIRKARGRKTKIV